MKHNTLLLAAAVCVLPATANAAEWQRHSYPNEGYSVEFSGPVQDEGTVLSGAVAGMSHVQFADEDIYQAESSKYASPISFDKGIERAMRGLGCKDAPTSDVTRNEGGAKIREMHYASCTGFPAAFIFIAKGNWFYTSYYMLSKKTVDFTDAERFLHSFRLEN